MYGDDMREMDQLDRDREMAAVEEADHCLKCGVEWEEHAVITEGSRCDF